MGLPVPLRRFNSTCLTRSGVVGSKRGGEARGALELVSGSGITFRVTGRVGIWPEEHVHVIPSPSLSPEQDSGLGGPFLSHDRSTGPRPG
jgi:hypothetical protein